MQVRKTAQAALLVLLEQELVAHNDVEDQVCPLLLMLTNSDAHDDFRTEAAAVSLHLYIPPLCTLSVACFIHGSITRVGCTRSVKDIGVKDMGSEMLA